MITDLTLEMKKLKCTYIIKLCSFQMIFSMPYLPLYKQTKNMNNFLSFLFQNSKISIFGGHQIFFKTFFLSFSFWNNRDTNVLLRSIFENAWKKNY